jgi:hypothetical protein
MDLFLGSDCEMNKATAAGWQQILTQHHLSYNNGGTVGNSVFSSFRGKGLYNEDTSRATIS